MRASIVACAAVLTSWVVAADAQTLDMPDLGPPATIAPPLSIATSTLQYGPAPAWVAVADIPKSPPPFDGGSLQVLLQDRQVRFGAQGDEFYVHTAMRVLNEAGLGALGTFQVNWDPDISSVTLHR